MKKTGNSLPNGPLLAWYGDDFTGAAAVMEVLSFAGLPSILFLEPPSEAQLARFPKLMGIGVASTARSQSPEWMDAVLPDIFARLKALDPQIVHHKVCSTLDSSPETGSIGRAIEIGVTVFGSKAVPILIAAPQMRRYQCFGHLYAGMNQQVYRLDRHPVMAHHPITPMGESDVARHIAKQSDRLDVGCLTLEDLQSENVQIPMSEEGASDRVHAFTMDSINIESELATGRILWENRDDNPFVVGSQGIEYALVRYWQETGLLAPVAPSPNIGRSKHLVVVSGSVSPTTAQQIAWSKANGFACIQFEAAAACQNNDAMEQEEDRCVHEAMQAISQNLDPLIYTAAGPDDPAVERFQSLIGSSSLDKSTLNQMIGESLGKILHRILTQSGARRAVVSGGDTSGHATRRLGIFALSALAPTIPGAALFKAHADGPMDGLELALKGGQMGSEDYFGWIRDGGGAR